MSSLLASAAVSVGLAAETVVGLVELPAGLLAEQLVRSFAQMVAQMVAEKIAE